VGFHRRNNRFNGVLTVVLMTSLLAGCSIEETQPPETGSASVSLRDTSGVAIVGARIRVDGRETPRYTPATLDDLPVGVRTIGVSMPGYADTSMTVEIHRNEMSSVSLTTVPAEDGSLDLVGAPEGTVLLINTIPVGTVRPATEQFPTLFERLGVGQFRVSAYLANHATELPAMWTVQLSPGTTVPLTPIFVPLAADAQVGGLAPPFELPCDWDSSLFRLQDYRGQVVLVTFFFSSCAACVEELPYIAALYEDPAVNGRVQFFGVDFVDSYPVFARFRKEHPALGITFPLLRDGRQSVCADYGVSSSPANFIVDPTGRVRFRTDAVSEPQLRQTVFQLLEQASGATVSFTMRDTLITYTDGSQGFLFHGRVVNLLNVQRTLVLNLTPVVSPDTNRLFGICTFSGCQAPRSGPITLHKLYGPLQVDSVLSFDVYSQVNDWSEGFPVPTDSAVVGDYLLRAAVYPADNTNERMEYDLRLDDLRAAGLRQATARTGLRSRWEYAGETR
jgi:peroxiredoxin